MQLKTRIFSWLYKTFAKRIFFSLEPEKVHNLITSFGEFLGKTKVGQGLTRSIFYYEHPSLEQEICGIKFRNPIGLAAGFDKNARLTQILPDVGFGFEEVGSVTGQPCAGNPGQRLWRLPKSRSLVVNYGLVNDGCEVIAKRLLELGIMNQESGEESPKLKFPLGVSIAKTNCQATADRDVGIADYVKAYRVFNEARIGDYFTLNISCPNAYGGQPFHDKESLGLLLRAIFHEPKTKPVFVKISPDLSLDQVDDIIQIVGNYPVDGMIISNLTKQRQGNSRIKDDDLPAVGGLSGKVVEPLADEVLKYVYNKTRGAMVLIGCGGVFSAVDAYRKIRLGASLIQLITGMIYQGPQLIGELNQGLVELLEKDGYKNISQVVGADNDYGLE